MHIIRHGSHATTTSSSSSSTSRGDTTLHQHVHRRMRCQGPWLLLCAKSSVCVAYYGASEGGSSSTSSTSSTSSSGSSSGAAVTCRSGDGHAIDSGEGFLCHSETVTVTSTSTSTSIVIIACHQPQRGLLRGYVEALLHGGVAALGI